MRFRVRLATWFRIRDVAAVEDYFSPYDYAMLRVAEQECPWGEMAENTRLAALVAVIQAMASSPDGAARSVARANSLFATLFDPAPAGKKG